MSVRPSVTESSCNFMFASLLSRPFLDLLLKASCMILASLSSVEFIGKEVHLEAIPQVDFMIKVAFPDDKSAFFE